jgi:(p)ppGpp synthase/HD superfamily hydrolase
MGFDPTLLARRTADEAHRSIGQVRKGSGAPYITHCDAVAGLVRQHGGTFSMIEAAFLHDTLEDTPLTENDILEMFGPAVLDLVKAVTSISKPEDGNRATRKAIDLKHYASGDARAQTIKLADIVDNLSDISTLDPKFAEVYIWEKYQLARALTKGAPELRERAIELCLKHIKEIGLSAD